MKTLSPLERVCKHVKQFDESLQPLVYEEAMKTSDEAAQRLGVEVAQIAKSILFRSDDRYGLFVAAGDVRIHAKQIKACLGGKKPKMATPEEVTEITGFVVGAVCPFGLLHDIPIFVDTSLQRFSTIYTAAGIAESLLPLSYEKLLTITGGTPINAALPE